MNNEETKNARMYCKIWTYELYFVLSCFVYNIVIVLVPFFCTLAFFCLFVFLNLYFFPFV